MCKAVEIGKTGDVLRYHPGIKQLTKKKSCRIFKIFQIMFFMDGTQKK